MAKMNATRFVLWLLNRLGEGYVYGATGQICTISMLKSKQAQYGAQMGEGYYQKNGDYRAGLCAKWIGRRVQDCSGLIRAIRRDNGYGNVSASAQGVYDQCALTERGQMNTFVPIPGTAVFMYSSSKHRMSHVGVYIGGGYVVESRGAAYGVVKTRLRGRGWTNWGRLNWLDYDMMSDVVPGSNLPVETDDGDNSTPKADDMPVLNLGDKGDKVTLLQKLLLKDNSMYLPKWGADGDFGDETDMAVRAFQRKYKLLVDGIVGIKTWTKLLALHGTLAQRILYSQLAA